MYPYEIFLGMSLYEIMILIGVLGSFITVRILGDRIKFSAKLTNIILTCGFIAIVCGYVASVAIQAVYNGLETGVFEIAEDTGATFLGGLIGGVVSFIAAYFIIGKFAFKNTNEHKERFGDLASIAGACISVAHGFGRIGCFFAGCCYGIETDSPLGVVFYGQASKRLPVQLFEAVFLFALYALLLILHIKKPNFKYGLSIYMTAYGIWRFFVEYLRGDDRGAFFVDFLTPSQGTSILLVIAGIILFVVLRKKYNGRKKEENQNI